MHTPNVQSKPSKITLSPKNFRWFLPSYHGDLLLERKDEKTTLLRVFELTAEEEKALDQLRKRATESSLRQRWASDKDFAPVSSPQYRTKEGLVITLNAKIEDVEKVLAKALNPKNRALFSAVKFSDGTIEKIHRLPDREDGTKAKLEVAAAGYRDNAKVDDDEDEEPKKDEPKEDKPASADEPVAAAAATVKEPVIGCPMPDFPEADVRASRALEAFLSAEQISDYRKHAAFVTTGRDTGHRYMICNREAPFTVRRKFPGSPGGASFSGLYDLDEQRPLCVHDWDSPPPEEMLTLHLCLSIPGYERLVRSLPHAFA